MAPSSLCEAMLKRFEGLSLHSYVCPAGVWTIGYGHTAGVGPDEAIDEEQADELLAADLAEVARDLAAILPRQVSQNQFDALCSLCFNVAGGARALPKLAPRLWADIEAGKPADAAKEFLNIDHALVNGKPVELPGLKARRQTEAALFLQA